MSIRLWNRQPFPYSRIANTPLTQGLVLAFVGNSVGINRSRGGETGAVSCAFRPTPQGLAVKGDGVSGTKPILYAAGAPLLSAADITIIAVANPVSEAVKGAFWSQDKGATSEVYFIANMNTGYAAAAGTVSFLTLGASGYGSSATAASLTDGLFHVWGARVSALTPSLWLDGVVQNTGSASSAGTYYDSAQRIAIGALANYNGYTANFDIPLLLAFDRALSNNEMLEIGRNPWQVFARNVYRRTINSVAAAVPLKTVNGLALASVKTVNGLAIGSVKTVNGLSTT